MISSAKYISICTLTLQFTLAAISVLNPFQQSLNASHNYCIVLK